MRRQMTFLSEKPRTDVALEALDVTNAVNIRQVSLQVAPLNELPVTHVTRMSGVGMLSFSVHRVVVSADR